ERHLGARRPERPAQDVAQLLDDARRRRRVAVAYEHGHRVETVEQEVWIDLRLQRRQSRPSKLLGEPGDLRVTLAYFDEVARGMLDADHGEIDRHAERQRRA